MKNIYLFQYEFEQTEGRSRKTLIKNFIYKTFIVVDFERSDEKLENETVNKYIPREEAISIFVKNFPHVDIYTVTISLFNGNIIDSCEVVD